MADISQLSCESLSERYGALLESGEWTDCEFLLGASKAVVRAHRVILAAASAPLAATLFGPMADGSTVTLPDIEEQTFKLMLRYIYTVNVEIPSFDDAVDLCYASHKYLLRGLTKLCVAAMINYLEPSNACVGYEMAVFFNETKLLDSAARLIQDKTVEVLSSPLLLQARPETLAAIFAMNPLAINNELQLLEALERYIMARQGMDSGSKKAIITQLLPHIRLLTLWPDEWEAFASRAAVFLSTFLSEVDFRALTLKIGEPDCDVPLPDELCPERKMRNNRRFPDWVENIEDSVLFTVRGIQKLSQDENAAWFSYDYPDQPKMVGAHSIELSLDRWDMRKDEASFMVSCGKSYIGMPTLGVTLLSHNDRSRPLLWVDDDIADDMVDFWAWYIDVPWEDLLNPRKAYVIDDSVVFKVDIYRI